MGTWTADQTSCLDGAHPKARGEARRRDLVYASASLDCAFALRFVTASGA